MRRFLFPAALAVLACGEEVAVEPKPEALGGIHNHVDTRGELRDYDAALSAPIERFMGDRSWRPGRPAG